MARWSESVKALLTERKSLMEAQFSFPNLNLLKCDLKLCENFIYRIYKLKTKALNSCKFKNWTYRFSSESFRESSNYLKSDLLDWNAQVKAQIVCKFDLQNIVVVKPYVIAQIIFILTISILAMAT